MLRYGTNSWAAGAQDVQVHISRAKPHSLEDSAQNLIPTLSHSVPLSRIESRSRGHPVIRMLRVLAIRGDLKGSMDSQQGSVFRRMQMERLDAPAAPGECWWVAEVTLPLDAVVMDFVVHYFTHFDNNNSGDHRALVSYDTQHATCVPSHPSPPYSCCLRAMHHAAPASCSTPVLPARAIAGERKSLQVRPSIIMAHLGLMRWGLRRSWGAWWEYLECTFYGALRAARRQAEVAGAEKARQHADLRAAARVRDCLLCWCEYSA